MNKSLRIALLSGLLLVLLLATLHVANTVDLIGVLRKMHGG